MLQRVLIDQMPFSGYARSQGKPPWEVVSEWPAQWLRFPRQSGFVLYRRQLHLNEPLRCRLHVTADERYELYLDGALAARGPERGDAGNWYFESFELNLPQGEHVVLARVWALGPLAPWAQITVRPGFLLAAEGNGAELLSTGRGAWEMQVQEGLRPLPIESGACLPPGVGGGFAFDCSSLDPDWRLGRSGSWQAAEAGELCATAESVYVRPDRHYLTPALLPPQVSRGWDGAMVRYAAPDDVFARPHEPIALSGNSASLCESVTAALVGKGCRVPAGSALRAVIDLGDYVCYYPELKMSGGAGARLRLRYAESLRLDNGEGGNRDVIDHRVFRGPADEFKADGKRHTLIPPWWRAGRYVQLEVNTGEEPLELLGLSFRETRYDYCDGFALRSNIPGLEAIARVAVRTLQMCSHEHHMDCPFYEQLQYVGDTRLQILSSFYLSGDARLAKKAILLFNASRQNPSGLTLDAYPGQGKLIAPFSLWWVAMLCDYARWRGEEEFIRSLLPGAREVVQQLAAKLDKRGLLVSPRGWNYVDATEGFMHGVPPGGQLGEYSAILQLHLAYTLGLLADLEVFCGTAAFASHWRQTAEELMQAARTYYWDSRRRLFADDLRHTSFSQHAQVMAILCGLLSEGESRELMQRTLCDHSLVRCNIYFSHYLIEAASRFDGGALLRERLGDWRGLLESGFRTFPESFGQTRSECHAWSSHILYHVLHTLVGLRPAARGSLAISLTPSLQRGEEMEATLAHPQGPIHVSLRMDGEVKGTLLLPAGVHAAAVPAGVRVETAAPQPRGAVAVAGSCRG